MKLKEILRRKDTKTLKSLFGEWGIVKPIEIQGNKLIDIFIQEAQKRDRIEHVFNSISQDHQLLVSLISSMGGRAKVALMHEYGLYVQHVFHSEFGWYEITNLDDIGLVFIDPKSNEYFIPEELQEGIFDIVKKQGDIDITTKKDMEATERYDMVTNLLRFLCFIDIEEVKIKKDGEIYKKAKEKLMAEFETDINCTSRLKPQLLSNYVNFVQYIADKLNLVLRRYDAELDSYIITTKEKTISFMEKDIHEKRMDISSKMDIYEQKILRYLLRYLSDHKVKNSWISLDAFFTKVKTDDILNFKRDFNSRENVYLLTTNYQPRLPAVCINRLAMQGIVNLHAKYNVSYSGAYERSITHFRLTDYGMRFLDTLTKTKEKGRKDENKKDDKVFIIHPNFEITVLPDTPHNVLFALNRMADPVKFDVASTYKLTKNSIIRAMNKGMNKKITISFIKEYSKNELPDNVLYSLKDWFSSRRFVQMDKAAFIETESNILEPILKHIPKVRKINDGVAIINEEDISHARELIKAYKKPFIAIDDPVLLHNIASKMRGKVSFKVVEPDTIVLENKDTGKVINVLKKEGIIVESKQ